MNELLFPLWQIDRREYDAICAYLGVTPSAALYSRLSDYLAERPFRQRPPARFARFLAGLKLNRLRIACLDPFTKRFLPDHRIRHALNGVIALHECDDKGYRELTMSPTGSSIVLPMFGWFLRFGVQVAIAALWVCWQWLIFAVSTSWRRPADVAGTRILITGVHRGLGRDLMFHCLEQGANVVGTVRTPDNVTELRKQLPAAAPVTLIAADLSASCSVVDALRQALIAPDSIAMAILCAGVKYESKSVLSLPDLRETFQVNFFSGVELSAWLCTTDTAERPARTALVMVSSMGRWHGMPFTSGYNASKAALSIWGESLAMELRQSQDRRFTVTIVEPGIFHSEMTQGTPLTRLLLVSRAYVAKRILAGALRGARAIRTPWWFAVLTWGVCIAGRDFRNALFARIKIGGGHQ